MISEQKIKIAFSQIKSDMSLLNGELAIAHERIAKLESILIRESVKGTLDMLNATTVKAPKPKKKTAKKKPAKKKKKHKEITWNDHVAAVRRRFPRLTLKESLEVASKTWKKKKKVNSKK